ncbi:MAG: flagellar hook protein FlgE [Balneolaceae bacterium]
MKSLNSGISGLRAFQTKMDVIGNNIANVDTVGFKSSKVAFSEMLSQQISSGKGSQNSPQSGTQIGLGVRVASINRDFNQGSLQTTGRDSDIAIEGSGFFMVNEGGQSYLTRAGNFTFNKDGLLVDQSGRTVQGFNADADGNVISGGTANNIQLDFENVLNPQATENVFVAGNMNADTSINQIIQSQSSLTLADGSIALEGTELNDLSQTTTDFADGDDIEFEFTLNDGSAQTVTHTFNTGDTVGDLLATINADIAGEGTVSLVDGILVLRSSIVGNSEFAVEDITVTGTGEFTAPGFEVTQVGKTGSKTISTTVYDDLGRAHTLLVKMIQDDQNSWSYEASFLDGEQITGGSTGNITFDENGSLTSDSSFSIDFDPGDGASPFTFDVNLGDPEKGSRISQFSGSSSVQVTSQDGYTEGRLVDYSIDGDGYINGSYSNGRNVQLAQLAVGSVSNVDGLQTEGDGLYRNTVASGDVTVNTAEGLSATSMAAGVLEGSNVDLAREFTDMITAQRAYQSNARIITTADELLTEAVNLKR